MDPGASRSAGSDVRSLRFGVFELDLEARELRRDGRRVLLAPRPLQVLAILASRSGEVVSREELRRAVWKDAWIDVESSINTAIRELRRALGDTPAASRYIATIPRSGYRFVAPVQTAPSPVVAPVAPETTTVPPSQRWKRRRILLGASGAIVLLGSIGTTLFIGRAGSDSTVRLEMSRVDAPANLSELGVALRQETLGATLRHAGRAVVLLGGAADGRGQATDDVDARRPAARLDVTLREVTSGTVEIDARVSRTCNQEHRVVWAARWEVSETATRELLPLFAEALAVQLAGAARGGSGPRLPEDDIQRETVWRAAMLLSAAHGRDVIASSRRAVAAAPDSGFAHATLAQAYLWAGSSGDVDPSVSAYRAALSAAERAVSLDPGDAQAHAALGGALLYLHRDLAGAAAELERALALEPRLAQAQSWLAAARSAAGEHAAATAAARAALAIDPLRPFFHAELSRVLLVGGDATQAETVARRALLLAPDALGVQHHLVRALLAQGRLDAAADLAALPRVETARAAPEPGVERWRSYAAGSEARRAAGDFVNPYWLATLHATLGDEDGAWHWLDEALEAHSIGLLYVASDPAFERLRASARWPSFVDEVFGPARRHSRSRRSG